MQETPERSGRPLHALDDVAAKMAQEDARFAAIFAEELRHLRGDISVPPGIELAALHDEIAKSAGEKPLAALCLSGGGIRSASFALGLLQGLARAGVLWKFDYLSTVSGGGYIGSFLSAWRHHAGDNAVLEGLDRHGHPAGREAPEIGGLRATSNYLTPKLGVLSADTWTALALVIRNLVLNWLVFLPFFMGVLFVPWLCRDLLEALWSTRFPGEGWWWIVAGGLAGCPGLACASFGRRHTKEKWLTTPRFLLLVLLPITLAAMCFTAASATFFWTEIAWPPLLEGAIAGLACYVVAWAAASLCRPAGRRGPHVGRADWLKELAVWALGGALTGTVLAVGILLGSALAPALLAVLGIGWTMLSIFAGELLYVGLRSGSRHGDIDREWLARAAGWLTAAAASCAVVFGIALFGPGWVIEFGAWIAGLGGISGLVAIVLGGSARTAATTAQSLVGRPTATQITSAAAIVFALCIGIAVSWLDRRVIILLTPGAVTSGYPLLDGLGAVVLILASAGISIFVNINRFSLHGLYRNRLTRTFLGSARLRTGEASRPKRSGDPFTGFDPADDLRVSKLDQKGLLHIVNVALNIVSTDNLAWQERRAESFTVSPLQAGNPLVGYSPTSCFGGENGGMSLGTAMAISGAAVSPNMGYHSSPLLGFLLMLFNVRLGCWLGNPAGRFCRRDGPRVGLWTMLLELANQTTADGDWVYLSDGGHFDNLGLYEMIRRRCRFIVVSDAGCDPQANLSDLGDCVRKASIDFGVEIRFRGLDVAAAARPPQRGMYCWTATITYPGSPVPGWLLYIRPGYNGDEAADIRSYASANPTFPHESTAQQWFGESQFEAYRALGQHQMELICGLSSAAPPAPPISLAELRRGAETYVAEPCFLLPDRLGNDARDEF